MKTILVILISLLISRQAYTQVSGKFTEANGIPVSYIGVSLLNRADSAVMVSVLTNDAGAFRIAYNKPGSYILRLSGMGYKTWAKAFELTARQPAKDFGTVIIQTSSKKLSEVLIKANRPPVQQRSDGIVINVEGSVLNKGSSALQVLERSPGVQVDRQNGGLSLNGKDGVLVLINGRAMRIPASQLTGMLNGMSADNIEKIELLTTPPAGYDAEGSAGLINIVMKKSIKTGWNGNLSLSGGYGYGEKATAGTNLNYNSGKSNFYGSYTYSRDKTYNDFISLATEDEPLLGGKATSSFMSATNALQNNHQFTLGVDTRLSPKTTIGGSFNYNNSLSVPQSLNEGQYRISDELYRFNATVYGRNQWLSTISNAYLDRQLRNGGHILLNADYLRYQNDNPSHAISSFIDKDGMQVGSNDTLFSPQTKGFAHTTINVVALKADYSKQLNPRIKLETGIKGTYTRTNSTSAIESLLNGSYVSSANARNTMLMRENIAAGYGSLTVQLDTATKLVAGLRYEYSNTEIDNQLYPTAGIRRPLGAFFPNLVITRSVGEAEWVLSYTKRISRPAYNDLASFITYNGPTSVNAGNPLLKPTITNTLRLGYSRRGFAYSLLFSRDKFPIYRYQIVATPAGNQMQVSPQNGEYQNSITLQANAPITVTDWWEANLGAIGGWRGFKESYTASPASKSYFAYSLSASQTFKLPAAFTAELSGYYNSGTYNGTRQGYGYGVLNAGLKKVLRNAQGSFQISATDLLKTGTIGSSFGTLTTEAFNLQSRVNFHPESSKYIIFRLSYTRAFGSGKNKVNKELEESERVRN